MCQALRELMKDDLEERFVAGKEEGIVAGKEEGIVAGKEEGKEEALLSAIMSLMQTMHLTSDAAMDALQIPGKEQSRYREMMNI